MFVEVYGLSDVGRLRELNEDSFMISGFENGEPYGICVLADGMGGHNAGEIASEMASRLVCEDLKDCPFEGDDKKITSCKDCKHRRQPCVSYFGYGNAQNNN